jgi:hypothetical protein
VRELLGEVPVDGGAGDAEGFGDLGGAFAVGAADYGLTDQKAILPALVRCTLAGAERIKYWPVSAVDAALSLERLAQELRWLQDISVDLARGL